MINDNGGHAFPSKETFRDSNGNSWEEAVDGMTLRDYFAAKAMQSLCNIQQGNDPSYAAEQAYAWADAMIKARG